VPKRVSEAFVLRTYPLREADLIVSFFTRDQGKLRGVARRARRPKSAFGAGLERLSQVRLAYYQQETRELVNLDSCELIRSQFELISDYVAGVALDYIAEVCEHLLPPEEANEKFFRLLTAVLDSLYQSNRGAAGADGESETIGSRAEEGVRPTLAGRIWRGVTYFSLWAVRLSGWLPTLDACLACGTVLDDTDRAFFSRARTGLICDHCRRAYGGGGSWELTGESRTVAAAMIRKPVAQIPETGWSGEIAADLRRFLVQQIETHAERRLITAQMMEEAAQRDEVAPRPDGTRRSAAF
jgi:DNA repair protein RecO (recombination protein O)